MRTVTFRFYYRTARAALHPHNIPLVIPTLQWGQLVLNKTILKGDGHGILP